MNTVLIREICFSLKKQGRPGSLLFFSSFYDSIRTLALLSASVVFGVA